MNGDQPPSTQGDKRPDCFHQSEWPCPLKEAVSRPQHSCTCKRQNEPPAAVLQCVADQHGRHREQSESCELIHVDLLCGSQGFDDAALGNSAMPTLIDKLAQLGAKGFEIGKLALNLGEVDSCDPIYIGARLLAVIG